MTQVHRDDAVEREERRYPTCRACACSLSFFPALLEARISGGGGKEDDDVATTLPRFPRRLITASRPAAGHGIPGRNASFRKYSRLTSGLLDVLTLIQNRTVLDRREPRCRVSANRSSNLGRSVDGTRSVPQRPEEVPRIALTRARKDKAIPRQENYADCRLESISIGSSEHLIEIQRRRVRILVSDFPGANNGANDNGRDHSYLERIIAIMGELMRGSGSSDGPGESEGGKRNVVDGDGGAGSTKATLI
ncbi:hypothetical protein ALC62_09630 [Cyphomyrmex costatus]|uniref:Uncharacterized protein n=1 Tax=Cyphomyrmex costatus TaxID=456900 RepID=A0A151IFE2_9HYME|nr:hypothetical protein ALC62_09630 [Cyphomyrmex costatus]